MASNVVVAGLGRSLVAGGLGGSGIVIGTSSDVQNKSYEIAGSGAGDAANWTADTVASLAEFATFSRPGLNLVTDTVPVQQPTLGFTVLHQLDGTLIIYQAANTDTAQEDFEQGWDSNEDFLLAISDAASATVNFSGKSADDMESGWGNDPGLVIDVNAIASATAVFSGNSDEIFGLGWPASFDGNFVTTIPNVVYGTWANETSTFIDGDAIFDTTQYSDTLQLIALEDVVGTPSFTIEFFGRDHILYDTHVLFATISGMKKGDVISLTELSSTGVQDIVNVTQNDIGTASFRFEGEPGFLVKQDQITRVEWARAFFQ